jgi:hypothetical protein
MWRRLARSLSMAEFDAQDVLERSLAAHTVKSGNQDFNQLGGSIGVLHEPTGLTDPMAACLGAISLN